MIQLRWPITNPQDRIVESAGRNDSKSAQSDIAGRRSIPTGQYGTRARYQL